MTYDPKDFYEPCPKPMRFCGTETGWNRGCRCPECRYAGKRATHARRHPDRAPLPLGRPFDVSEAIDEIALVLGTVPT